VVLHMSPGVTAGTDAGPNTSIGLAGTRARGRGHQRGRASPGKTGSYHISAAPSLRVFMLVGLTTTGEQGRLVAKTVSLRMPAWRIWVGGITRPHEIADLNVPLASYRAGNAARAGFLIDGGVTATFRRPREQRP
jgi:hypothetical protein